MHFLHAATASAPLSEMSKVSSTADEDGEAAGAAARRGVASTTLKSCVTIWYRSGFYINSALPYQASHGAAASDEDYYNAALSND